MFERVFKTDDIFFSGLETQEGLSDEALMPLKSYKYSSVDKSFISNYILRHYVRTPSPPDILIIGCAYFIGLLLTGYDWDYSGMPSSSFCPCGLRLTWLLFSDSFSLLETSF